MTDAERFERWWREHGKLHSDCNVVWCKTKEHARSCYLAALAEMREEAAGVCDGSGPNHKSNADAPMALWCADRIRAIGKE